MTSMPVTICYPLLPHEWMTWATFRRHMSTPFHTQHHSTYLTVSYRIWAFSTRFHQISAKWSRMGSCQTRCLLPILINPDPTVYGSCSFSGKQWKTMEDIIEQQWKTLKNNEKHKNIIKHHKDTHVEKPWKTEGPERQSLVALALTLKTSLPAEWQSGLLKNELCDAMWCFDMLCVEMRAKAVQPEFTKHIKTCTVYCLSTKIEKWHGIIWHRNILLTDLTISHPVSMPHDSTSSVTCKLDSFHSFVERIFQPGAEITLSLQN